MTGGGVSLDAGLQEYYIAGLWLGLSRNDFKKRRIALKRVKYPDRVLTKMPFSIIMRK
jgi:hypothetical protein